MTIVSHGVGIGSGVRHVFVTHTRFKGGGAAAVLLSDLIIRHANNAGTQTNN